MFTRVDSPSVKIKSKVLDFNLIGRRSDESNQLYAIQVVLAGPLPGFSPVSPDVDQIGGGILVEGIALIVRALNRERY